MGQIIAQLTVELHGNKEITINGFASYDKRGKHILEEQIVARQLSPDQILHMVCETEQLLARLRHVQQHLVMKARPIGKVISIGGGLSDAGIPPLPKGK